MDSRRMRVLRFLARGPAACGQAAGVGKLLLDGADRGAIAVASELLREMAGASLIARSGQSVQLTPTGTALVRRNDGGTDGHLIQHQDRDEATVETATGWERVTVNHAESPLAALARRRAPDGKPFLSEGEVRAGERLRSDYTRGQLMARTGMNWSSTGAGSGRNHAFNGMSDLTDAALAARQRVEKAIGAVGPELSGLLVDVCCFLKGLERVEAERRWPQRSAKILLKTALGMLARHYEPGRQVQQRERIVHWGAEGYRPSIRGNCA